MYLDRDRIPFLKDGYNKLTNNQFNLIVNNLKENRTENSVGVYQEVFLLDSLNRMYSVSLKPLRPFPPHSGVFNILLNVRSEIKPYLKQEKDYKKTQLATMGVYYLPCSNSLSILHIVYSESLDIFKVDYNLVFPFSEFKEKRKEVFGGK